MNYEQNSMNSGMGGQQMQQNQGFAAHPRVVHQKQKFKDPYGMGAPVE